MRKKKVLVHGTLDSLQRFFADAISSDYEIVAILNESLEKISIVHGGRRLEGFPSQNVPKFVQSIIDAVIITDVEDHIVNFFLQQGFEFRKIILWSEKNGWEKFEFQSADGTRIASIGGLEFHIRNEEDEKFFKGFCWRLKTIHERKNLELPFYEYILAQRYLKRMGKPLDFNNPQTFTEKMQWMKIHDATPIKSRLADKYLVRNWIEEKIGGEYLIPLLGVWDDFDDINFDDLPDQFVLKCNHGSAMNVIVRDKNSFDKQLAREKLNAWMSQDFALLALELHYTRINRKIIAEKFMTNGDLPDLIDYKFLCFEGKVVYCQYLTDRSSELKLNYFDENWQITNVERSDHPRSDHPEEIPPPKNFELMKELAAKLAEGFAFVRVDFYEIDGKVYFGEMTFTPGAGNFSYKSEGTDEYLGSLLKLPEPTPPPNMGKVIAPFYQNKPNLTLPFGLKLIASLTSWKKRIDTAHLAVKSILNQSRRPDLTVLYLAEEEFPRKEAELPPELLALRSKAFEIRWVKKNIRSYKKLIPALKDFPDDVIITFDDDIDYRPEFIERLLIGYKEHPDMIQAHRITNISFDEAGNVKTSHTPYDRPTYLHKFTGVGSVLYPPYCLHKDVLDEEKFLTLAPTSDDIWFWLMGVLNGRRVNVVKNNIDNMNYIPGTQEAGLTKINDVSKTDNPHDRPFDKHLNNILNAYPVLKEVLYKEQRLLQEN